MYDTMGVLGILSAGAGPNQNWDIDVQGDIPTTCPSNYMIAVTNTTNTDARNVNAPYGPINMDIGAPGTGIYSTYTTNTYQFSTGTSMATPHVAGAIGLYYAGACNQFIIDYKSDPGLLAQQMRTYLLAGVDSISALAGIITSEGRLNIHKGLLKVQTYNCLSLPPLANFAANDQAICIGSNVNYTDASTNGPTSWDWSFPGGSPSSSALQNPTITYNSLGTYDAQLIATNSDGSDTVLFTNYITVSTPPAIPVITESFGVLESSQLGAGNQWYYGGGLPVVGATNDTYVPSVSGNYYVVYTDINGCTAASALFNFIIGIEDEPGISFSIYPNPASEKVILDAGTIVKANIKIMDLSGRTVINTKMNQSQLQVDLSALASGVYMIKVEYGSKSITKKIVKR
jgi:PKD repeat protein